MIEFINKKKGQARKLVENEEVMAYLADIRIILNNNGLLFKNNVKYIWTKFIQDNKMTKKSIKMFFNNLD